MAEKQIIYILGAGRSGTTLIDIILGNSENIFSAGELNRYAERKGVPHNLEKLNPEKAKFWKTICDNVNKDGISLSEMYFVSKKNEYHTSFFNLVKGNIYDEDKYKIFQKRLFDSIFNQVEATVVTDSSKYPMRLYSLSKTIGYEIKVIYFKRNPLSVVKSFSKKKVEQPSKNWFAANLYLLVVHSLCKLVLKKIGENVKVTEISYDDLVTKPIEVLKKIQTDIQINLKDSIDISSCNSSFKTGNLFDGNRIRLLDEIHIKKPDIQPRKKRSIKDKFVLTIHKFWWY